LPKSIFLTNRKVRKVRKEKNEMLNPSVLRSEGLSTALRKSVALTMQANALTMQANALTMQANALTMQADALTMSGIAKINSLRINEMLYLDHSKMLTN
jgi:hypothetical protein